MESYALPPFSLLRNVLNKPKVLIHVYIFVCPLFRGQGLSLRIGRDIGAHPVMSSSAVGPVETVSLPQFSSKPLFLLFYAWILLRGISEQLFFLR